MSSVENSNGVYVIITNIPKKYRSNQLRNFFSSFVESGAFLCFHYIHRPEVKKCLNSDGGEKRRSVSFCCIIKVVADRVHELIETYNGQHWLGLKGETLPMCCFIKEIKLSNNDNSIHGGYKWAIPKNLPIDKEEFSVQEVESLHEMRPPSFMPKGNVGTTTDYLLKEIQGLPPRVIRKFDLPFPSGQAKETHSRAGLDLMSKKDRRKLKYYKKNSGPFLGPSFDSRYWNSQFPSEFSYWQNGGNKEILHPEEKELGRHEALLGDMYGQGGSGLVSNPYTQCWNGYRYSIPKHLPTYPERASTESVKSHLAMCPPSFMPNGNILHPKVAEWNRYQSLHHVYGQGTSDWVFRKGAQYWNGNEGYFHSNTSVGLDTNTEIPEEPGMGNNKDMREAEVDKRKEFAFFEKHNKGIGSKILKALGWKEGEGIGKNGDGIAEPLPNEGQCNKKGFGYQPVKLDCPHPQKKKRHRHPDDRKESDQPESVSASNDKLKYQKEFLKGTI